MLKDADVALGLYPKAVLHLQHYRSKCIIYEWKTYLKKWEGRHPQIPGLVRCDHLVGLRLRAYQQQWSSSQFIRVLHLTSHFLSFAFIHSLAYSRGSLDIVLIFRGGTQSRTHIRRIKMYCIHNTSSLLFLAENALLKRKVNVFKTDNC